MRQKAQAFGQQSKEYLSSLVFGRRVLVETGKKDRYERTVGKVVIDGRDANLAMVVAGMAWHYTKYQGEQPPSDRLLYADAEQLAAKERRVLWSDESKTPPWAYRRLPHSVKEFSPANEPNALKTAP